MSLFRSGNVPITANILVNMTVTYLYVVIGTKDICVVASLPRIIYTSRNRQALDLIYSFKLKPALE